VACWKPTHPLLVGVAVVQIPPHYTPPHSFHTQIEYVLTDKTGTLTENIMALKVCTINGVQYGTFSASGNLLRDSKAESPVAAPSRPLNGVLGDARMVTALDQGNTMAINFFLCMAVNNSVVPSVHADGHRVYKVRAVCVACLCVCCVCGGVGFVCVADAFCFAA
jgi:hypothetical protein